MNQRNRQDIGWIHMKLKDLSFQFSQRQKCCPPKQLFNLSFNNHCLTKSREIYLDSDVFVKLFDTGNQPRKRRFCQYFLEVDIYPWKKHTGAGSLDSLQPIDHDNHYNPLRRTRTSRLRLNPWVRYGAMQPPGFWSPPLCDHHQSRSQ